MADRHTTRAASLSGPASHAFAITPHDETALDQPTRALYVGTTGDVRVITVSAETVTFRGVPGGTILPLRVRQVTASGTSAGDIVGLA